MSDPVFFEWDDKYSVKVPSIDRQHKVLIDYINQLQQEITKPEPDKKMIGLILKFLVDYTNSHFKYEEMLFGIHQYPDQEDHKAVHNRLIDKVGVFKQRFDNDDPTVGPDLLAFLKDWLNHHILIEDMSYSNFMVDKNVQ